MPEIKTVLLTGATGFVGRHLYPALCRAGYDVVCVSRDPARARERHPQRVWTRMDVEDPDSVDAAMRGCDAAVYLVHGMGGGGDYEAAERRAAESFRDAAARARLRRVVYLGGVRPKGEVSTHLRSRLATGEILRGGPTSTIELQAAMIVGAGSESWRIVRDLAARLPAMVLPRWLETRSQPVAIADVVAAIVHAVALPDRQSGAYAIPGPEEMSGREVIERVAALMGLRPTMYPVPFLSPRLSSYWIRLVTRANGHIAEELVEGMRGDLTVEGDGFWARVPGYERTPFDLAARRALEGEARSLSLTARAVEGAIRSVGPLVSRRWVGPDAKPALTAARP